MVAIVIFSVDQTLRRRLEQLPRKDPAITLVGIADSPAALLALAERHDLDVVLSGEVPAAELLADWQARHRRPAWIVFLAKADEQKSLEALGAGASAVLSRSADLTEIVAVLRALASGFIVLQRPLLVALLDQSAAAAEPSNRDADGTPRLTAREIEVLAALADGASNKEIARRLDISFHTVKFHVAAILDKLEAESRTEAVVKASQLGIVML
ncbi:MAG TPA: response regulator transcription factor [Xanthobacteraceae bacterium]|jgi:NarL family two-component system response regulator YdfI|nr:response regulator transcription factor [Xanthobacteraceae bacterium]